ncbi:YcaO-like family protein [Streptomyces sp. NBC_00503]|uniref:YcaO-like family protein n=1 Tax=Streptomyces sp. NBC_00503 TaxID=2903659 RepID=UPI002E7FB752|nr:YcaO-like family protein [Streptomyces sp. NBC_00503]WUD79561.1 YcaO-like family protein [Streptomyces sp. NBC_00503]
MQTEQSALSWLASPRDLSVFRLPGTNRARLPAATWEMASRAAAKVGVTRVADITRLDTIGIATFQAVRPLSRTLAVSQGKGMTPELAKLSAVMESVETWHVEQPVRPALRAAPRDIGAELGSELGYDVHALPPSAPSLLHDGLPLDWMAARSLVDGARTYVPVDVVRLSLEERTDWNPPVFFESTNGLAGGNTLVEATLHALCEVIERDAMTAAVAAGGEMGVRVDPRSSGSAEAEELCALIERAGVTLEVRLVPSPTGLPCFLAWVACHDYPAPMFGFGCHLHTGIALTRAVSEAAQARLAYISGARDDLKEDFAAADTDRLNRAHTAPAADIPDLVREPPRHDGLIGDLEYVVRQAAEAFSHPPLVVDLTRDEIGVPVVKVVAPGSRVSPEVL